MHKIISKSEKETLDLASEIAKGLKGGDVIELNGDLGAGKTLFSKGIARALGVAKIVTSPTFVVMKVYPVEGLKSIKNLCHIDAYRIGKGELEGIGALEYIGDKETVCLIEWASNVKDELPQNRRVINMSHVSENEREIEYKESL